ncbi:MAG TPA: sodium-dependent transporter [Candidatus Gemmiger excrementipullorum]|uniref:Sodium-dependent transporter n=1 Tax=Candidatus Gemmiger excrementipullorum TaxID=2838610 RepID=A0A9D1Y3N5_9FIRM|nr:sodium-dependent transporter [Candidatus Gemmiger excrementipullorum]
MDPTKQRESFASRLGFILVSAGCAIGIGNVWRFPTVTGESGGGVFVLFYLLFLVIMGVPVLTMELAVGRAGRGSAGAAYKALEPKGSKWHLHGWVCMLGCAVLMMYYTTVSGWMLDYFFRFLAGNFEGVSGTDVETIFQASLSNPGEQVFWMVLITVAGFLVCGQGLQSGLERAGKWMMGALIVLILVLVAHSFVLPGVGEGLAFYLLPDWERASEQGLGNVISAAMNQSFFTLSLGIGAMEIFGSYMERKFTLPGEAVRVCILDTFVAVCAGLIIFPACFTFGIAPDYGPQLIFVTLPNVFANMAGGRLWGALFFLFMTFASFTTVIAVFENLIATVMDQFGWSRRKGCLVWCVVLILAGLPCALGFNLLSGVQPLGAGTTILDFEDFLVSNLLLPGGSLVYLVFCVSRWGWGYDKYMAECNTGEGLRMPRGLKYYFQFVLPVIIAVILIQGLL